MFCAISGGVPEQPVVSTKSGHVFEKRLIEKYVREAGKCPVTEEALTVDDLLPVKAAKNAKPRTAPATSIPGLLGMFHDEWDALMLEHYQLRQSLNSVRQELCHALYQQDAATRVIARLIRERDEARAALENARATILAEQQLAAKRAAEESAEGPNAKKAKAGGISEDVLQELQDVHTALSKGRRKREISKALASTEEISNNLSLAASVPLHKTTQPGIASIDINPENVSIVATGGYDSTIQLYDAEQSRHVATLEGHSKRVTGVSFVSSSTLLSSSYDKTVRVWRANDEGAFNCSAVLKEHTAEVVGVTLHPGRKHFASAAADAYLNFYDLSTATCLRSFADEDNKSAYTAVQFHPDGLILGTGTEGNAIKIWELRAQKLAATLNEHVKPVTSLSFSENGYLLACAAEDGVKVWDLRKLKVFKSFTPYEEGPACAAVAYDYSSQYLAVGGADTRVYQQLKSDFNVVRTFPDMPKKGVLSLKWGPDARTLFVGTADHNLRIFTVQQ